MSPVPQNPATAKPAAPALPAASGQAPGATTVQGLQTDYIGLTVQLAGLKAQWNGLQSQLNSMRLDNPARAGVQQQTADLGVQMAKVEGQLATLKLQIAQQHGHVSSIPVGDLVRGQPFIDFGSVAGPLALILAIVVLGPLSFAFARRMGRLARMQPVERAADPLAAQRMERLEQAVDSIAIEVERISENQRFMTRVLVERNPTADKPAADGVG